MARAATSRASGGGTRRADGVYAWLLEREEAQYRDWQTGHGRIDGAPYMRQRQLDVLRAGRPIVESAGRLPVWAQPPGTPSPPTTRAASWTRATADALLTVNADDLVAPHVDGDGSEPLATCAGDYRSL